MTEDSARSAAETAYTPWHNPGAATTQEGTMTNPDHTSRSDDTSGWHDYGNYVTLLVRRDIAGTPMVRLMDVDQFSALVRELGSLPEFSAIGNDGKLHQAQDRMVGRTIAFHFPTGSQNDFAIARPPIFYRSQPQPDGTPS